MLPRAKSLAFLAALFLAIPPLAAHDAPERPVTGAAAAAAPVIDENSLPLDPRFSPERVKAHVAFLSDDLLEGRDTGTRGHEIAARYVAQQFAALGLKPMGDVNPDGSRSWFQRVTFQKTERVDAPAGVTVTGPAGSTTFDYGVDSLVSLNAREPVLDITAPLVFVGFGIENDRLGLHDYAGLDVRGKIVVVLRGYPDGLPSEEGAYFLATKGQMAQARGAIGVISVDTLLSARTRSWDRRLRMTSPTSYGWVSPQGVPNEEAPGVRASASVSDKAAEALFAGTPQTLAKLRAIAAKKGGIPKGFPLKTSARIFVQSRASRITSPNVVAMLPGSDPALADKFIVLSGHLDHLGLSDPKPGDPADKDRIYNGALDNAAGTATTIEVAHAMAQDKVAPRRSLLFLITTAEEKGKLGAEYFANHPTVPIERIAGNVDLDMPVLLYPFTDVIAFGADHSSIGQIVTRATAPMQVSLAADPMPQDNIFVRSDHYAFVKRGVPAVFLVTGYANGGEAAWTDFLTNRYHQPGDDMRQAINWRAGARFAEANYRVTRAMADGDTPPLWYQGDFFGDLFAPKAARAPSAK
ncbi:MAG TPA: M28 family metallopeptidase [Sphingobium sp.]